MVNSPNGYYPYNVAILDDKDVVSVGVIFEFSFVLAHAVIVIQSLLDVRFFEFAHKLNVQPHFLSKRFF